MSKLFGLINAVVWYAATTAVATAEITCDGVVYETLTTCPGGPTNGDASTLTSPATFALIVGGVAVTIAISRLRK